MFLLFNPDLVNNINQLVILILLSQWPMTTLAGTANYNSEASMLTTRTRMKYLRFMALDLVRFVSKFYTAQKKYVRAIWSINAVLSGDGCHDWTILQIQFGRKKIHSGATCSWYKRCVLIMFLSFRYTPNIWQWPSTHSPYTTGNSTRLELSPDFQKLKCIPPNFQLVVGEED